MNRFFTLRGRVAVVATLAGLLSTTAVGSSLFAQSFSASDDPEMITLTARDVDASNQKAGAAFSALVTMWSGEFKRLGVRFAAPHLVRYRGGVRTNCGVMAPSNASYCWTSNTIYFDDVFVATQAKLAARALGTDGDMTAIGIIAHEMGHAVAMQLGYRSRRSYDNEAVADCLAGAFARQAQKDGSIEDGDIDEAVLRHGIRRRSDAGVHGRPPSRRAFGQTRRSELAWHARTARPELQERFGRWWRVVP